MKAIFNENKLKQLTTGWHLLGSRNVGYYISIGQKTKEQFRKGFHFHSFIVFPVLPELFQAAGKTSGMTWSRNIFQDLHYSVSDQLIFSGEIRLRFLQQRYLHLSEQ